MALMTMTTESLVVSSLSLSLGLFSFATIQGPLCGRVRGQSRFPSLSSMVFPADRLLITEGVEGKAKNSEKIGGNRGRRDRFENK